MLEIVGVVGVVTGALVSYVWMKNSSGKQFTHLEDEAKVKAKMLEQEAKLLIESSKIKIREQELALEESFKTREMAVDAREHALSQQEKSLSLREEKVHTLEKYNQNLKESREKEIHNAIAAMESIASFTKEEAKAYILEKVEENARADVADIVRKYEQEAKREGEKKANYILAQATTRYAGDFAGERLINYISLPSDEHKGRIIGKEGRNIKTLEMLLGVDIVVDETPGVILVSCFNLYRRAIATRVIEVLIEDGRIHPGHIEEVYQKVEKEFEAKTYEEGENILLDLGLFPMAEELVQLLGRMKYRASYGQNALAHTLEVAYLSKVIAAQMGGDEKLALRAGLLHDIGKALTQEHGGSHVDIGVELCRKHGEHPSIINAIYAHHGYEEPDSVESAAVCAADKLSAARPGARREVLESFTKRVKEVEEIALGKKNVMKAYAINAGREIRVFVNAKKTSDNEAVLLSKEIAKEVQEKVQYPGEIKVNVIRETRATSYAK